MKIKKRVLQKIFFSAFYIAYFIENHVLWIFVIQKLNTNQTTPKTMVECLIVQLIFFQSL